jgi:hypothetical protein
MDDSLKELRDSLKQLMLTIKVAAVTDFYKYRDFVWNLCIMGYCYLLK